MRISANVGKAGGPLQSSDSVVVSPHPDDAVLSCWDVLTRPGVRHVVTVFAGLPEPGTPPSAWDRLTECTDPRERVVRRRAEDRRALRHAGLDAVHLDFVGAVHRRGPLDAGALHAALETAIGDYPTVYLPAAIGGHPDHVAVRNAALAVAAGRRRLLYADQPYAARFGWPSWVTGAPAGAGLDVGGWLAAHLPAGVADTDPPPDVVRLTGAAQSAKCRAITEYGSQFAALRASAGARFPYGPRWAYEVTWRLS